MANLSAAARDVRVRMTRAILAHRIRARHPTLESDPTAIWDYGYADIDAIALGRGVHVGPFAEIIVYKRVVYSNVEGRLELGDKAVISTGANIRAAGGHVRVGAGSVIGQHSVVVAANHRMESGVSRFNVPWDEARCGVDVGRNVWIGASCVLLPGCEVGNDSVIGAGSVVRGIVHGGELWAGVPARKIRTLTSTQAKAIRDSTIQ